MGFIVLTKTEDGVKVSAIEELTVAEVLQMLQLSSQYFINKLIEGSQKEEKKGE